VHTSSENGDSLLSYAMSFDYYRNVLKNVEEEYCAAIGQPSQMHVMKFQKLV
jgi:hypothetical protein